MLAIPAIIGIIAASVVVALIESVRWRRRNRQWLQRGQYQDRIEHMRIKP